MYIENRLLVTFWLTLTANTRVTKNKAENTAPIRRQFYDISHLGNGIVLTGFPEMLSVEYFYQYFFWVYI